MRVRVDAAVPSRQREADEAREIGRARVGAQVRGPGRVERSGAVQRGVRAGGVERQRLHVDRGGASGAVRLGREHQRAVWRAR